MSSYVNFYLRINDTFAPLGYFSRSSTMYQAMRSLAPYEKIRAITYSDLKNVMAEVKDQQRECTELKSQEEARCNRIMNAANTPLKEKLNAIEEIESNINDIRDEIDELEYTFNILLAYSLIIDAYRYTDDEEHQFENDFNHYLYAGVEANGSIENII